MPDAAPTATPSPAAPTPAPAAPARELAENLDYEQRVARALEDMQGDGDAGDAEAGDEGAPELAGGDPPAPVKVSEPATSTPASAPPADDLDGLEARAKAERDRRRREREDHGAFEKQRQDQERRAAALEKAEQESAQRLQLADRVAGSWDDEDALLRRVHELTGRKKLTPEQLAEKWEAIRNNPGIHAEQVAREVQHTAMGEIAKMREELAARDAAITARETLARRAQMTTQYAAELPLASAFASRRPREYAAFVAQAASEVDSQEDSDVLLHVEEKLKTALALVNELQPQAGAAKPAATPSTQSTQPNGRAEPRTLTNRDASESASLLDPDEEGLSYEERTERLEKRLRRR